MISKKALLFPSLTLNSWLVPLGKSETSFIRTVGVSVSTGESVPKTQFWIGKWYWYLNVPPMGLDVPPTHGWTVSSCHRLDFCFEAASWRKNKNARLSVGWGHLQITNPKTSLLFTTKTNPALVKTWGCMNFRNSFRDQFPSKVTSCDLCYVILKKTSFWGPSQVTRVTSPMGFSRTCGKDQLGICCHRLRSINSWMEMPCDRWFRMKVPKVESSEKYGKL